MKRVGSSVVIVLLAGASTLLLGVVRAPQALGDPAETALRGRSKASVQLKLARHFERVNKCGPSVFHFRRYLALSPFARDKAKVRASIRRCLARMKLIPLRIKARKHKSPTYSLELPRGLDLEKPVRVSGGVFLMGRNRLSRSWLSNICLGRAGCSLRSNEFPLHRVNLSTYAIDRTEVTNGQWRVCVNAGKCRRVGSLKRGPRLPVVGITWHQALGYCRFRGGRLPTEAEWEKAARGLDVPVRIWPWGRVASVLCGNLGRPRHVNKTRPVGRFPCDASYYGVLDMGGNVREWVLDTYTSVPPKKKAGTTRKDPKGPRSGSARVVKGGSWRTNLLQARVAARQGLRPSARKDDLGFRCARPLRVARKKSYPAGSVKRPGRTIRSRSR